MPVMYSNPPTRVTSSAMNLSRSATAALRLALALVLVAPWAARAFPPAPHHLIYGIAKDEYGTPLVDPQAKVLLLSSNGVRIVTTIVPGLAVGINFALEAPMDAGITRDLYKSNALKAATPYKLYVVLGSSTNTPLQMTGGFTLLGKPAQQTRLDLTLGEDTNGNGIPDAWEYAFLTALGLDLELGDLKSGTDYAGDGRTLAQEYLLGNYPFDPVDSFAVRLVSPNAGAPLLEFTTMVGRTYTVLGSTDLRGWTSLSFQIPAEGSTPTLRGAYYAAEIRTLQVQVVPPPGGGELRFFRLLLQ